MYSNLLEWMNHHTHLNPTTLHVLYQGTCTIIPQNNDIIGLRYSEFAYPVYCTIRVLFLFHPPPHTRTKPPGDLIWSDLGDLLTLHYYPILSTASVLRVTCSRATGLHAQPQQQQQQYNPFIMNSEHVPRFTDALSPPPAHEKSASGPRSPLSWWWWFWNRSDGTRSSMDCVCGTRPNLIFNFPPESFPR